MAVGQETPVSQETGDKERVQGVGGFFSRAKDPKKPAEWYERHLGITRVPENYDLDFVADRRGDHDHRAVSGGYVLLRRPEAPVDDQFSRPRHST